jgi:chemotaxis protein CheC
MSRYIQLTNVQEDALREIASIGTGNAITALTSFIKGKIEMTVPEVKILEYDDAITEAGGHETIVAGVLVKISGDIEGIMLFIQQLDFINTVLDSLMGRTITDYEELNEFDISALTEMGNIIISSYLNAMSQLTGISTSLSVPSICVNMLGGILTVPMAVYGYEVENIMTLGGDMRCDGKGASSKLFLVPNSASLQYLFKQLGIES